MDDATTLNSSLNHPDVSSDSGRLAVSIKRVHRASAADLAGAFVFVEPDRQAPRVGGELSDARFVAKPSQWDESWYRYSNPLLFNKLTIPPSPPTWLSPLFAKAR